MIVALTNRVYVIDFFSLETDHIIPTYKFSEEEPYNVISLSNDPENMVLACPTVEIGYILLVFLESEKQRRIRAHQSRSISLFILVLSTVVITLNGDKVATASEKGMNIRIFNVATGEQIQEVRRGNEYGMIYSMGFSKAGNWLTCTSDSNIVHVFACKSCPEEVPPASPSAKRDTCLPWRLSTPIPSQSSIFSANFSPSSMPSTAIVAMKCPTSKQKCRVSLVSAFTTTT